MRAPPGIPGLRGREPELSVLLDAFRSTTEGRAGAVLIGGDAGIGKTSLVNELVRHARRHNAIVLVGNAIDIVDAPAFWPVLSAVRNAVRSVPDDETRGLLRRWI